MARMIAAGLRAILGRFGYVLWKRDFLRYGVDPFLDIRRLSVAFARPVRTFFDVGANEGQTALDALKAFPAARIVSFEPHPAAFARLSGRASVRLEPVQLALDSKPGTAAFYEYGTGPGGTLMNSLVPNARFAVENAAPYREIQVQADTLDAFCVARGVETVDVLKIDVEGCELRVLEGAERMLSGRRITFIYVEFNDLVAVDYAEGGALLPIAEYLARWGYRHIATYTDTVRADMTPLHVCANALFAIAPA